MLKLVLISIFVSSGFGSFASHIVGGEMFYDYLGGGEYKITVKLYRDCLSDGAQYDQNLPITVFNGSYVQIDQFTIPFPGSTILPVEFSNPCVTIPNDICTEEAIYERTVTLPPSASGWTLAYQRCCRGPNVTNLVDPGSTGLTLTVTIPPLTSVPINSSPRFNNFPPLLLCTNTDLIFDHSATDPDADVLVYELCPPFTGGSNFNPAPNPASAPPYGGAIWAAGINTTNPFGTGSISIDANTGLMTATPGAPGLYAMGVRVREYRNGILIGTSVRDFLFRVMNCQVTLAADLVQQPNLNTFVSYCQGLTIDFENSSFGGSNYAWDFGVPGINTDVSSAFAPSYTYPGPGTYEVALIVNPDWPCTDTAVGTFTVNNEIDAFFVAPEPQCVIDNSFNFVGEGTFPAVGTTFSWDFGSDATPGNSTDQNPGAIVYSSPGTKPVSFTVTFDQCETSFTGDVVVAFPPTINFSVPDELKCVPYMAEFTNLSTASTPLFSAWDFGDGGTSSDMHPSHMYNQVGVYDVSLSIWTTTGCIDTLTLDRPNLIEVFPRPTSQFSISPFEQIECEADFFFVDQSIDAVESWFYFADGSFTNQDSVWYNYLEPGVYNPWQIVYNEFGCYDKSFGLLKIIPVMEIMVPNAFTPNGDSFNNVFQPVLFEDQRYELWIYNKWGEQIYYTHEMNANWDGTSNGQLVPDDIYIWKILYTSFKYDDVPVLVQGHVAVLK